MHHTRPGLWDTRIAGVPTVTEGPQLAQSGSSQDELDSLVYYRFLLTTAVRILTQRAEPP